MSIDGKFKIYYDEQPNEVVDSVAGALSNFGLTIEQLDGGDGCIEYQVMRIEDIKPKVVYEYEMLFKSEPDDAIKIDGWVPITVERLKHPEKVEEYLAKGILRKIQK